MDKLAQTNPSNLASLLGVALSIISIIASGVAIHVMLYVKACIGPIQTQVASHEKRLDRIDVDCGATWSAIGKLSDRVARMEGHKE